MRFINPKIDYAFKKISVNETKVQSHESEYNEGLKQRGSLTFKSVMKMAGRQAQGFVESLFMLMNIDLPVPDHSTVSRRLGKLLIEMPVKPKKSKKNFKKS